MEAFIEDIISFATCLSAYRTFLSNQAVISTENQSRAYPECTLNEWTTVVARKACTYENLKQQYKLIDAAVRSAGPHVPVLFDKSKHLNSPFDDNMQRYRFWDNMCLSVPVDLLKFSTGGPTLTTYC